MPTFWRALRPMLLVAILVTLAFPFTAFAQDSGEKTPIVIQGTPELETLVGAIRDAFTQQNPDIEVQLDPRGGLRGGFEALCNGEVDIVMSTEPITDLQMQACANQGTSFIETVLAYEAVALLAPPAAEVDCLDQTTLFNAWQLGAPTDLTWADLMSATLDTPIEFYGPNDLSSAYLLFRSLVPAGDLRDDIVMTDDPAAILAKVQEDASSAFAFMSLADLERLDPEGTMLPVSVEDDNLDCIQPALSTLENRTYPLGRALYLYVSPASAQQPDVQSFMEFALTNEAGAPSIAADQGYTVATEDSYQYGLNNVLSGTTGRTFTRPSTPVSVSTAEAGTILMGGTSMLYDLIHSIQGDFEAEYPNATIDFQVNGNAAGWDSFCAGEIDVLETTEAATDEQMAACAENGIEPYPVQMGYQALVMAVPASNDWLQCMTPDLVSQLLRAGTDEVPAPTTWNAINSDWPESDILLVLPPLSTGQSDYLAFTLTGDLTFAPREATLEKDDPLYRLQGIANTDNGFTYVWWNELQHSDANVSLLQAGENCVAPSLETILDGSYPLSYPVNVYFNPQSFDESLVRAFLWHFYSAATLDTLADYEFAGLDLTDFGSAQRDAVFTYLADYEAQQAAVTGETGTDAVQATEEATVEPTEEVTPEATEAATVEPTEEVTATEAATVEPTEEVTPEATEAATVEPTEEVTPEATEAAVVEPTEEVTPEATEAPAS